MTLSPTARASGSGLFLFARTRVARPSKLPIWKDELCESARRVARKMFHRRVGRFCRLMFSLRNTSLQAKQTIVIMATCTVALLLACLAFALYEVLTFRAELKRNISVLAEILANNTIGALQFDDADSADQILAAVRAEPNILMAVLYDQKGAEFSRFVRNAIELSPATPEQRPDGFYVDGGNLVLFWPVVHKGERVGTVYLK